MKSLEVMILGKSYSFNSDDPERLQLMGEELNEELEQMKEKYSQFPRDHLLLLRLLRMRLEQPEEYVAVKEKEKVYLTDQKESGEQLDLEIDDILNSEF
ncbi:MAG: cell division protein ZapA [Candidatus Cloacimonetes bacterium]|nr:cell division protein ZapA [Candidatus Cloacimonadota bacterium]